MKQLGGRPGAYWPAQDTTGLTVAPAGAGALAHDAQADGAEGEVVAIECCPGEPAVPYPTAEADTECTGCGSKFTLAPEGDVPQQFTDGPQGFFGDHAEWGHAPSYTETGGVECSSCGESFPAPRLEAEAEAG